MSPKSNHTMPPWMQKIKQYVDSYLDTPGKKAWHIFLVVLAELVAAYLIAIVDVGLRFATVSPSEMWIAYQEPDVNFRWGVFLIFTAGIQFFSILVIWKNGYPTDGRNFKLSKSDVYGSGREITMQELKEVANVTHKDATTDTIIGQLDDTGARVISTKPAVDSVLPNDNVLVFAPPGCGKTTSYVLPYIVQAILRRHSVICSDTKGELYAKTAELARRHGFRVLRLNLKDPAHSDGWNVLRELRHDDVRALVFAQTVMANTGNPHDNFAAPQESLLKACCLYQERHPDLADSQRTFYNAFSLLLQGADALDSTITEAFNNYGECMQVVSEAYSTFLQGSPNLRGNIITGLANRLQILSSPPVREMTSTDEIDFASMGEIPTILYISMSDQDQAMSFLSSLAFSFAFQDLVDHADATPSQRLKIPVCFLMEEFYSLGFIPNIGNILSTGRSRGISVTIIVQSKSQLIERYEENLTNTILADCATWVCLGCNDPDTAKLLEWRSGEATVEVKTMQHDALEPKFKLSHRHSSGDGRRNFYNSNDIMKIRAKKEVFIVWQMMDAKKCLSFPIFKHHEFLVGNMPQISANAEIPLSNQKAKKLFRQWENERVESFNIWLEAGGNPLKDYMGFKPQYQGKAGSQDLPDIIPIHSLERMALAKAAGEKYDPTKDPDSEQYIPPKTKKPINSIKKTEPEQEQEEDEELWDLTGITFEKVSDVQPSADETPPTTEEPEQKEPSVQSDSTPTPSSGNQKSYAQSKAVEPMSSFFGTTRDAPSKTEKDYKTTALTGRHKNLP